MINLYNEEGLAFFEICQALEHVDNEIEVFLIPITCAVLVC